MIQIRKYKDRLYLITLAKEKDKVEIIMKVSLIISSRLEMIL